MDYLAPQISLLLATAIFTTAIFLHLTRKDSMAVFLYMIQSTAIAALLIISSFEKFSLLLLAAIICTVAVKIFIAPYFFFSLIKRHRLKLSGSAFLNMPATLTVIALLVALTRTDFFQPLAMLAPAGQNFLLLALSTIFISLFLNINRKGALLQTLGILSLENGIVFFALFAGLEQNPALQLGITFNILIWVIVATVFSSMIFQKFGSLDVSSMKGLTE